MANLIVRNLNENIVLALKKRAASHNRSAEAEHRAILESVLSKPPRKNLTQILASIPNVGRDEDFERVDPDESSDVLD